VGVLLGVLIELAFAASAAEIVGFTLVLAAAGRLLWIDLHAANYVFFHLIHRFLYWLTSGLEPQVSEYAGARRTLAVKRLARGVSSWAVTYAPIPACRLRNVPMPRV
jgi:hypothetical protein